MFNKLIFIADGEFLYLPVPHWRQHIQLAFSGMSAPNYCLGRPASCLCWALPVSFHSLCYTVGTGNRTRPFGSFALGALQLRLGVNSGAPTLWELSLILNWLQLWVCEVEWQMEPGWNLEQWVRGCLDHPGWGSQVWWHFMLSLTKVQDSRTPEYH